MPDLRADLPADDLGSVAAYSAGLDITQAGALAYSDVAAAWRNYLATRNHGRPFVLIGHSQGSLMLQQLIAREIENDPAVAARMRLAIIPGFNVLVPQGRLVGGTFKSTPLCSRPGQTGCVIAGAASARRTCRPTVRCSEYADRPGMTVGCVNPALPGSTAWVRLDSYWFTRSAWRCRAGRSSGRARARRARPTCTRPASPRANASTTGRAAICGSAPITTPATSAPTASAARSACSACSCPAGACTCPTWRSPRAT